MKEELALSGGETNAGIERESSRHDGDEGVFKPQP